MAAAYQKLGKDDVSHTAVDRCNIIFTGMIKCFQSSRAEECTGKVECLLVLWPPRFSQLGQEQQLASLRAPGIQRLYCWGCGRGYPAGNGPGLKGGGKEIGTKGEINYGKWNKKTQQVLKSKRHQWRGEKKEYILEVIVLLHLFYLFSTELYPCFIHCISLRAISLSSN